MINKEKVINGLKLLAHWPNELIITDKEKWIKPCCEMAITLLKEQEPREPHYTTLEYLVDGTKITVHHPECPRCFDNGLTLWDAEIERGQAYCKRCGQAIKWDKI